MATARQGSGAGQLCTLFRLGAVGDLSDRQLLERFTGADPELADLAFSVLVERHGPMVCVPARRSCAIRTTPRTSFRQPSSCSCASARGLGRGFARALAAPCRRPYRGPSSGIRAGAGTPMPSSRIENRCPRFPASSRRRLDPARRDRRPARAASRPGRPLPSGRTEPGAGREDLVAAGRHGQEPAAPGARAAVARLSRRGAGLPAAPFATAAGEALHSLPLYESLVRAAAHAGVRQAVASGLISARAVRLFEETLKTMFMNKLRIGVALTLLAGCFALGAAGVFAQQDDPTSSPRGSRSGPQCPPNSAAPCRRLAQLRRLCTWSRSRTMIVECLEQELLRQERQLAELNTKLRSPESDPAVQRVCKTIAQLSSLLDRIDPVLADAVDEFPTVFDFSLAKPSDAEARAAAAAVPQTASKPVEKAAQAPTDDEHSLARASDRLEWARRMHAKGYVTKAQVVAEERQFEALKAQIEADLARAEERVEWARKMFEKGYITQVQYNEEILKHYTVLKARVSGQAANTPTSSLQQYYTRDSGRAGGRSRRPSQPKAKGASPLPSPLRVAEVFPKAQPRRRPIQPHRTSPLSRPLRAGDEPDDSPAAKRRPTWTTTPKTSPGAIASEIARRHDHSVAHEARARPVRDCAWSRPAETNLT